MQGPLAQKFVEIQGITNPINMSVMMEMSSVVMDARPNALQKLAMFAQEALTTIKTPVSVNVVMGNS